MIRERAKNAYLEKQLAQFAHKEPGRIDEMANELAELTKCFEKSELIRKQQKTLITKMKT